MNTKPASGRVDLPAIWSYTNFQVSPITLMPSSLLIPAEEPYHQGSTKLRCVLSRSYLSSPPPLMQHSWLSLPSMLPNNPAEPVGLSSSSATDQSHSLRWTFRSHTLLKASSPRSPHQFVVNSMPRIKYKPKKNKGQGRRRTHELVITVILSLSLKTRLQVYKNNK